MRLTSALLAGVLAAGCDDGGDAAPVTPAPPDAAPSTDLGRPVDAQAPDAGPDGARPDAAGCDFEPETLDAPEAPPIHTPRWAFEPWISKDISDRGDTFAFVDGFAERDIPVGVVVLDSPWETHYNTFVPHPERYPDFAGMVAELRARDIRTVLWVTQMVNLSSFDVEAGGDTYLGPSPNFAQGQRCGFFVEGGNVFPWWKGRGAGVDFFNPAAVTWWHRQQDALYAAGIAGWKLDFGDSYIKRDPVQTAAGPVPHQAYSEAYYRDFYADGATRLGTDEFVTMVRPYDRSYEFEGRFFARPEHAPVAWVGDNRRDFVGLHDALDHIFRSVEAGYVVVGSDIGGYLDLNDQDFSERVPADIEAFNAWVAVGALTPFMQLHGRANLTPWTVPERVDETVAAYRYWAHLHHALVPFFYSLAEAAYGGGEPLLRPQGALADWSGDYRFMVGDALLVAPELSGGGVRDVALPPGRWFDWWQPAAPAVEGGVTLEAVSHPGLREIPLFVKAGAILPVHVDSDANGLGGAGDADALTLLYWPDLSSPDAEESAFVLYDVSGETVEITARDHRLRVSRTPRRLRVRVWAGAAPAGATVNGAEAPVRYDAERATAWVEAPAVDGPTEILLR